jgi:penicillin-binding protein A
MEVSCNSAFAEMGAEDAGADAMADTAEAFGFDHDVPIDLPRPARSSFPAASEFENDAPKLAQSSIGQNDVRATPLQMALVAAAVANGGEIMTPHVVREVRDDQGEVIERIAADDVWTRAMSGGTADLLRQGMIRVVQNGTASRLDDGLEGYEVGGKTGTAQIGSSDTSHAWIIGFAGPPGEAPSVAVAVIVEGQPGVSEQTGGTVAAPIAAAVMRQALEQPVAPADQETGDPNSGVQQ